MHLYKPVILGSLLLANLVTTVLSSPLKFPDSQPSSSAADRTQESSGQGRSLGSGRSVQGEGRFININKIPNGLFNRLSFTDKLQDDIEDYDDQVGSSNDITERPDRRRHGHRRPCVPYQKYRSNDPSDNGRTFVNLFFNDYNIYGGGGGGGGSHERPQYDTYGGYPCHSWGSHSHRPHRPHRPSGGGGGGGLLSDDTSNRPPFWGPGGIIDLNQILSNWLRPGSAGGSGALGDSVGGGQDPKPILELNVQDTISDTVQTAGGFLGAVQGLFSQTPPLANPVALADPVAPVVQSDEPERDPLIQPRPSKRPHKHHTHHSHHHHSHHHSHAQEEQHDEVQDENPPQIQSNRHRAYWPYRNTVNGVTQIAGGISGSVNGYPINQVTGPQLFAANNRRYGNPSGQQQGSSNTADSKNDGFSAPWWSFFGLFN